MKNAPVRKNRGIFHKRCKSLCVGAAEGFDLLILILILIFKNQDQEIAAFGSSYNGSVLHQ
jgi:hypothetical protein